MLVASKREGKRSEELAEYYTEIFFDHCAKLNIIRPDIVCKATEHIQEMIDLVKRLEEQGFAYQSAGNVYFDVERFERYGDLAKLDMSQLQAGARIDVDTNKRNAVDFALWFTKSKFENQELQWDSPWGVGYPGWHIECSAMAMRYLGESFDIHCGGIDHIPVHHTNEIAQSEAATGKRFAKFWLHGGFLVTGKDKMSKSAGEFLTLDKLIKEEIDPIAYRLFCLSASYRSELAWSWEAIKNSMNSLRKIKASVLELRDQKNEPSGSGSSSGSEKTLDLNMSKALAVFHETLSSKEISAADKLAILEDYDEIFGLGIKNWQTSAVPEEVSELMAKRDAARLSKDWAEADNLRDQLQSMGYSVEDSADGTKVRKL
ncbi:UNVERIFIED_CONTAM: hypothetical protein GTU68_017570 [Idotea baltica]|nr:hypothetical protein [Idotea baltica]